MGWYLLVTRYFAADDDDGDGDNNADLLHSEYLYSTDDEIHLSIENKQALVTLACYVYIFWLYTS